MADEDSILHECALHCEISVELRQSSTGLPLLEYVLLLSPQEVGSTSVSQGFGPADCQFPVPSSPILSVAPAYDILILQLEDPLVSKQPL